MSSSNLSTQEQKDEKTTTLQLFKRRHMVAKSNFDSSKASKKEIREYHKLNYENQRNKMRKLRCKVLMLTKEIKPEEPGHAVYRRNRLKKIDMKRKMNEKKRYLEAMGDIKKGKRMRFVTSKPHITERNAVRYKSTPFLSTTPASMRRNDHKIEELCEYLTDEEIDLISDDPLYFFTFGGKVIDERLVDQEKWDEKVGIK